MSSRIGVERRKIHEKYDYRGSLPVFTGAVAEAQSGEGDRFSAAEERRNLDRSNATRRRILNRIVHCGHGLDPNCSCVQNFSANIVRPLTEQQAKVGLASYIRSEMEKSNEQNKNKYNLLSRIIKGKPNERDFYINRYEEEYGSLLADDVLNNDPSVAHLKPSVVSDALIRKSDAVVTTDSDPSSIIMYLNGDEQRTQSSISSSCKEKILDICQLGEPIHKIERKTNSCNVLVANDRCMLIHNESNLCLINTKMQMVRQTAWMYGSTRDMCWNTKRNKIYITSDSSVFVMDPQAMTYEKILSGDDYDRCTCSRNVLYLTTQPGYEILEYSLSDLGQIKLAFERVGDYLIEDICFNAGQLGLVANTRSGTKPRVEILSATTYACLFSIVIQDAYGYNKCHISSLGSSGWLVKDEATYNIHHLTENNELRMTPIYNYGHPYNVCRFGAGYLVVLTGDSYNLHKLNFVTSDELTPSEVWKKDCTIS